MEYKVYIYIYLFPIVWGSNIGPQAHNGPTVRCGFWGSPSDPSPEASERWQDAGQFIAGLLVPHMLPGDFLGCYLFIFVHICQAAFLGIYDILHVWYVFFWRILKLRTLQPLLCTDSMLSTCETGFRGDVLAGGKLGLEPILAAARIAGMGQQSWLLTHWYNIYIYVYIILYYIILYYIILYIFTYMHISILSHPIRSVYLSIYLLYGWWYHPSCGDWR